MTKFEKIMEEYKEFAARVAENHKSLLETQKHLAEPGVNVEMVGEKANKLMENHRKLTMEITEYFAKFNEVTEEVLPQQPKSKKADEDV